MPGIQNSKGALDFLDGLGNYDTGDKVQFNNVSAALAELADFLITEARGNMDKKGNTATGGTAKSMKASDVFTNATKLQVDISIDSTYKFLDQGVKGVEGGTGKYQFKTKYPNKKMALAILKWVRKRGIATKYKAISKTEVKNQRIKRMLKESNNLKGMAYAISTNIKKKGIKPTRFFTKAIEATKKEQKKRFADALKLDIIETFN
ncbi:MAG: hypothetical protein IPQ08_05760 [Chitinophagaceae bacterium]|nr:hypothetical protein [Chitinophagaceae bacterium]